MRPRVLSPTLTAWRFLRYPLVASVFAALTWGAVWLFGAILMWAPVFQWIAVVAGAGLFCWYLKELMGGLWRGESIVVGASEMPASDVAGRELGFVILAWGLGFTPMHPSMRQRVEHQLEQRSGPFIV